MDKIIAGEEDAFSFTIVTDNEAIILIAENYKDYESWYNGLRFLTGLDQQVP
jgi:hypothetical protein